MPTQRDTVKPWFETGDFPTQSQFWTLFDYLRFKDEKIGLADLTDQLIAILNARVGRPERRELLANDTILMPAEYKLCGIAVKNTSAYGVVLALNYPAFVPPDPGDNWIEIDCPAGQTIDIQIDKTFWAETSISVGGITGVVLDAMPVILLIDRK